MLVEFLIENRGDVFGEETPGLSCPSAQESPAPVAGSTGMRRKRGLSQAGVSAPIPYCSPSGHLCKWRELLSARDLTAVLSYW